MSLYLTSSKVCLLVLVAVYCEGVVPVDATISVLSLVTSQQLPIRLTHGRANAASSVARPRGIVELEEIQSVLSKFKSASTSHNLWNEYQKVLSQISNLDALFTFFSSLKQVTGAVQPRERSTSLVLARTSLIGSFVRRSQLEFEKLSFQDAVALWQSFSRFTSPLLCIPDSPDDELESIDAGFGGKIRKVLEQVDVQNPLGRDSRYDRSQVSSYDDEGLLEAQHQQMRRVEHRLLKDMRIPLDSMPHSSPQAASLSHYVTFLDASLSGDYSTSFEYLHRYYDYDMRLRSGHSFYQFALLSTALLQAGLGCYDEAVKALHETVAIARENKDTWCLIFTLHWLHHIQSIAGKDAGGGGARGIMDSDSKSLAFLKAKAMESKVWPIASATLLREAQLSLHQGRRPQEALERVFESFSIDVHHGLWSEIKSQQLQHSAILARLGVSSLASSYCNLAMDFTAGGVDVKERLQARCRSAHAAVACGNLKLAQKLMADVQPDVQYSLSMQQLVQSVNGAINLKMCLHRNQLQQAEIILCALHESPVADPDVHFQTSLLELDYLSRLGDFDRAYSLIERLSSSDYHGPGALTVSRRPTIAHDAFKNIRLMLAKAKLFIEHKIPQKGFSLALRASVAALEAFILPTLWEAIAVLAIILVAIGEPEEAMELLWSIIWPATESGDLELIALIQSACSDTAISIAGKKKDSISGRAPALRLAITWAERAYECYDKLGHLLGKREMMAKISVALRILGENDAAREKNALFEQLHFEVKSSR